MGGTTLDPDGAEGDCSIGAFVDWSNRVGIDIVDPDGGLTRIKMSLEEAKTLGETLLEMVRYVEAEGADAKPTPTVFADRPN